MNFLRFPPRGHLVRLYFPALFFCLLAASPLRTSAEEFDRPPAGMLRHPAISQDYIAFGYATQLWIVPREGGVARPIASPPGSALFPHFSPDGLRIAFVANYDGQRDIHVMPTEGGIPRRLTTHPGAKHIHGWTPDGANIVYSTNHFSGNPRITELYTVSSRGGTPQKLPVPYGVNASFRADGKQMAYMPHSRDFRTWKRYAGGRASNIWIFDLEALTSERITEWDGTDTSPMWHGDSVYFLSDKGEPWRLNLWRHDRRTGERERITDFRHHDVRFPALGPADGGEIVFQLGQELWVINLTTREIRRVDVEIPGARPEIRVKTVDASKRIENRYLSPSGARVLVEARGDLWTLPARRGSARNLTRTTGIAEREPSWSPDGEWILYSSDATGEYELYLRRADGTGDVRQITFGSETYYMQPHWAPDSKRFVVVDKSQRILYGEIPGANGPVPPLRQIGYDPNNRWIRLAWSPDSRWIVYSKAESTERFVLATNALWAVEIESGEERQLTSGMFSATDPVFDSKGEFLAFTSGSEFSEPQYEDVGSTFVYHRSTRVLLVPLRKDIASPLLPKSDEESDEDDETKEEDLEAGDDSTAEDGDTENGNGEDRDNEEPEDAPAQPVEPMEFDWDGFEQRAILLPIERGNFAGLAFNDKRHLVYQRTKTNRQRRESQLQIFNPFEDEPKEKTVLDNVDAFGISADGKKLLITRGSTMSVINAAADQKWEHVVPTGTMRQRVDPRQEWAQILRDAWRRHRDFFYVENLHNVDWDAVWESYSALLPYLSSRGDLQMVIGEMISELNVGHAYIWGGDFGDEPEVKTGRLGADFAWVEHEGAWGHRIEKIHTGGPWDYDARGPLSQPGVEVAEGDFLLAVNGAVLDEFFDPWAALAGLANEVITLRVAASPNKAAEAREIVVRTMENDQALRYRAWVEAKRRYVEEHSDGRVGYIHVPDTAIAGQNELFRQYYGQIGRKALLIDERWNGGGQLPHRFVELLNRPHQSFWARRDGKDWATPSDGFSGPMAMLINEFAGSGGDAFPHLFRKNGLGKLIGTRTWGGLVGITRVPGLIDGGYTAVPTFGIYNHEGRWIIEGWGVEPDIFVVDDPALMVDGRDPQLDAAIEHLLEELEERPFIPPARPAPPDRSGFGIDPAHR